MTKEQFYRTAALSDKSLQELMVPSNAPALFRFAIQYFLLIVSAAAVVLRGGAAWWQWAPALFVFGVMTAAMYAACHETLHGTAFRSRRLNRFVCGLAAATIYYTPTGHRQYHFTHHRHTQDPLRDPEISPLGMIAPEATSNLFIYLAWMSGIPILLYKLAVLVAASIGHPRVMWEWFLFYVPVQHRKRLRAEARMILSFHVALIVVGVLWLPGFLYLIAGQLLGHILVTAFTTADHQGLPNEGSILERTRSVRTNRLVKFLMWNMPYHAEHHAYPAVPWHALPRLRAILQPEIKNERAGYLRFHRRVIEQVRHGSSFSEFYGEL